MRTRNLTAGIFFSYNGITGYDPSRWQRSSDAYEKIIAAYRQDGVYILPFVKADIVAVQNGANLVELLEEQLNKFLQI